MIFKNEMVYSFIPNWGNNSPRGFVGILKLEIPLWLRQDGFEGFSLFGEDKALYFRFEKKINVWFGKDEK